jgi:hypothetical protein
MLGVVEFRDAEELEAQLGRAAIAHHERQPRSEPAAGTVADDCDARRIHAELVCVLVDPRMRGKAVVEARRERILGSQPVGHRDHQGAHLAGDRHSGALLGVDAPDCEPASMDVDDGGAVASAVALVGAHQHLRSTGGAGHGPVCDA